MKIYIAGKITGNIAYRQEFAAAERRLAEMGFSVMNPAWLYAYPAFAHADYIAVSRAMLERCEAVLLLPHWGGSAGVKQELAYAKRHDLPVFDSSTGEAGCWSDLRTIAAREQAEREERLGVGFKDWLREKLHETLKKINAPGAKKDEAALHRGELDAFSLAYEELERRER